MHIWGRRSESMSVRAKYAILAITAAAMIILNLLKIWSDGLEHAMLVTCLADAMFIALVVWGLYDIRKQKQRIQEALASPPAPPRPAKNVKVIAIVALVAVWAAYMIVMLLDEQSLMSESMRFFVPGASACLLVILINSRRARKSVAMSCA